MAKTTQNETPLMAQYNGIKAKYPDAVLLFRVGDFYETFGQDDCHGCICGNSGFFGDRIF